MLIVQHNEFVLYTLVYFSTVLRISVKLKNDRDNVGETGTGKFLNKLFRNLMHENLKC